MKRRLFLMLFLTTWLMQTNTALAQIGVNTASPKVSLDVKYNSNQQTALAGIRAPQVTGDFLHTKTYTTEHNGAIVFVKTPADEANQSGQTVNVTDRGYYYFDAEAQGGTWIAFKPTPSLPSSNQVLTKIGTQADDASVTCDIALEELLRINPPLSRLMLDNLENYKKYIDEHPNNFSAPATQAEVQTMIDKVNTTILYHSCIVKVSATQTKEFMCHNMGADQSLNPHDMSQANAWALNGSYIQWGRKHDMYDTQNNGAAGFAAAPTSYTEAKANKDAISGWNQNHASNDAWDAPANQPCPSGYRLPTKDEWEGMLANNSINKTATSWTSSPTNYGSAIHFRNASGVNLLTLPTAGKRVVSNGSLTNRGNYGYYWSSTPSSSNIAYTLDFNSSVQGTYSHNRKSGFSVRCLKGTEVITITAEQISSDILEQIGNEADNPDNVNSVITTQQLRKIIPAITGIKNANETAYQDYIDEHPNRFSTPATQAEVKTMVGRVNAAILYGPCIVKISATQTKEFMCYNMGADQSLDPHDINQPNAWALNGSYIQWGHNHNMYDTNNNGPDGFAAAPTGASDAQSNKGAISGWNPYCSSISSWENNPTNHPCPSGYRLPTVIEWLGVLKNNSISKTATSWNSSPTNYGSAVHFKNDSGDKVLTLPATGFRYRDDGSLSFRGEIGCYWSSSSDDDCEAFYMIINSSTNSNSITALISRRRGMSIRCLKD